MPRPKPAPDRITYTAEALEGLQQVREKLKKAKALDGPGDGVPDLLAGVEAALTELVAAFKADINASNERARTFLASLTR